MEPPPELLPPPEGTYPTPIHPGPIPRSRRQPRQKDQHNESGWLSTDQIRQRVRVRREVVKAAMDGGELPYEQRGRGRYARLSDVEEWEKQRLRKPGESEPLSIDPDLAKFA